MSTCPLLSINQCLDDMTNFPNIVTFSISPRATASSRETITHNWGQAGFTHLCQAGRPGMLAFPSRTVQTRSQWKCGNLQAVETQWETTTQSRHETVQRVQRHDMDNHFCWWHIDTEFSGLHNATKSCLCASQLACFDSIGSLYQNIDGPADGHWIEK